LREVRAAWPLIEAAAEWETSSLRMKDEKNGTIRKYCCPVKVLHGKKNKAETLL
jgi:hypothetical protein